MTDQPDQPVVPPGEPAVPPPAPPGWATAQPPPYGAPAWQPPPGWGYQSPAPKPGVVPLRPLSVLEILDGSITTIRQYWRPMLGLAFAVSAVLAVVGFLLSLLSLGSLASLQDLDPQTADGGDLATALVPTMVGSMVALLLQFVGVVLLTGMLTAVVGQAVLGRDLSIGEAWDRLRPLAWRLIGLVLLVTVAVVAGLVLCILPGLVLAVFFSLAAAVLVLERATVTGAVSRSWSLVGSAFWRTLWILLLVWVIYGVITTAVSIPFSIVSVVLPPIDETGAVNEVSFLVGQALSGIGSVIAGTIGYPFIAAAIALTYIDRRMRREGLDLELARATSTSG